MSESMPLAEISAYRVPGDVTIERVAQRDGPDRWAVRAPLSGTCLGREGEWEPEPSPSSRDDAFYARCRFATVEEAYQHWQRAHQALPTT